MKQNVYVMIDCVSGNNGELFTMANDAAVIRSFSSMIENTKKVDNYAANMMRDTHIYCIGTFDSSASPMLESISPSRFVVSGASLISDKVADSTIEKGDI